MPKHSLLGGLLALAALATLPPAAAAEVECRYTYGGETTVLRAAPVESPYTVPTVTVGSYFLFRVVVEDQPAEHAAVKTYVYADRDGGAVLIHQASFAWPPLAADGAAHGFSGLHRVYEPVRDGEFEYWCRLADGAGRAQ